MSWISLALALIQLVNYVFGKLDADAKAKAMTALIESENLKADLEAIGRANSARSATERGLADKPERVRAPDASARRTKPRPK